MEGDLPLQLQRVTISGTILASLLHRCSADSGDTDGLLFGRVSLFTPSSLSDDSQSPSSPAFFIASVTGFFSPGTTSSFYDSAGNLDIASLRRFLHLSPSSHFLGWFSSRRRSSLRPSVREFSVSHALSSESEFAFSVENSSSAFLPSIFLLITTPLHDHQTLIQTHDYRIYQFSASVTAFEAKPFDIVNIGPAFRGHYNNFSPNSEFPHLSCNIRSSSMEISRGSDSLTFMKRTLADQKQLDLYTEAYNLCDLNKLVSSTAVDYTSRLENLYENMLDKLCSLTRLVESSSAKVLEKENYNARLRDMVMISLEGMFGILSRYGDMGIKRRI